MKNLLLIITVLGLISGCYKTEFESEKIENQKLRVQVQQLESEIRQFRETAQFNYGSGTDAIARKQYDEAKQFFQTIIDRFPNDPLVPKAMKALTNIAELVASNKVAQEKEFSESGEPISYDEFYAKVHTGTKNGKRFSFQACLLQSNILMSSGYGKGITVAPYFDDTEEYKQFLMGPDKHCGTIVAALFDGQVTIYRLH